MDWLYVFGLIIVVLLLIPNIIYFRLTRNKVQTVKNENKILNIIENISRYACIFFMVINLGICELGFKSNESFALWLIITGILILLYWSCWVIYYKYEKYRTAMFLAVIPCVIFLETGISMSNYPLIVSTIVFAIAHIYITHINEN